MKDSFEINAVTEQVKDELKKTLESLENREQQAVILGENMKVTVERDGDNFLVREPDMKGIYVTSGSADKVSTDMMAIAGGKVSPVLQRQDRLKGIVENLLEGESRSFQLGGENNIWNIEKREGSYLIKENGNEEVNLSFQDADQLAGEMIKQGDGVVKVEADRWKYAGSQALKDILKNLDGVPTQVTANLLNTPIHKFRLNGKENFEFQPVGKNEIQSLKLDHPQFMSKKLKELTLDQAALEAVKNINEQVLER